MSGATGTIEGRGVMMWHGGWGGGEWALMSIAMLFVWTLIVLGAIWLARSIGSQDRGIPRGSDRPVAPPRSNARDILDERYARGELNAEEYRERRDVLSGR